MSELVKRNQIGRPKILIIGGIAGGASCAARARRLSENAEIIVFEQGKHVSFASCGLPYYVGDLITNEKDLLVATPELFRQRFNIDVRVLHEVTKIDRSKQTVAVQDLHTGQVYQENYDFLVLSPVLCLSDLRFPGSIFRVFSLYEI